MATANALLVLAWAAIALVTGPLESAAWDAPQPPPQSPPNPPPGPVRAPPPKADCTRPAGWCTHAGSLYSRVDCDGDGFFDVACIDNLGKKGTILSSTYCSYDSWPNAPLNSCSKAFVNTVDCARPMQGANGAPGWCIHAGSTYAAMSCTAGGHIDQLCKDTSGSRWTALSKDGCAQVNVTAPFSSCPIFFANSCTRPTGWCSHAGATYWTGDCDGDGKTDHACRDTAGNKGTILSSQQCVSVWPYAVGSTCAAGLMGCPQTTCSDQFFPYSSAGTDCDGDGLLDWGCVFSDLYGSLSYWYLSKSNCVEVQSENYGCP